MEHVWVMGKVHPGWYIARWVWDSAYAQELTDVGYEVVKSIENPAKVVTA